MSNYRAGDMIRMTRLAMGMSQETLCENICSVQTLSRIENGKVKVKSEIYRMLMERMGRSGLKAHGTLRVADFDLLDVLAQVSTNITRCEYEKAEEGIKKLEACVDMNDVVNRQTVGRRRYIIDYSQKKIDAGEYVKKLEQLLALTVPDYRLLLDKDYPFMDEELQLLLNISNGYCAQGKYEFSIEINFMLIRVLNGGYMEKKEADKLIAMLVYNTARRYGGLGKHQNAVNMCKNAIWRSKRQRLVTVIALAYGEMAWNIMEQVKKGERKESDMEQIRLYMKQGHAAAVLSGQRYSANIMEDYYKEYFGESIYFSDALC